MSATIFPKEVKHEITQAEMVTMGAALADALVKIHGLEVERADFMKGWKVQVKEERNKVRTLSKALHDGFEMRVVECKLIKDYLTNTVKTVRSDTGEVLEERTMTEEERQKNLIPETESGAPRHIDMG